MADKLKDGFDLAMMQRVAAEIWAVFPRFRSASFVRAAVAPFPDLELMPRGAHVAEVLRQHLPARYPDAVEILVRSFRPTAADDPSRGFAVFRYLPHSLFIARFGLDDLEASLQAQYVLTQHFTAEFSIRPFLERYRDATLDRLSAWAGDANVHVRRLVSEGTRPRLPWATRLRDFQKDPTPVLALLDLLKDDSERYVQRSVANNLNDIAKDHPAVAVATGERWLAEDGGASPSRRWIVSHAMRSLVKCGDTRALHLMGTGDVPRVAVESVRIAPRRVRIGGTLHLQVTLRSTATETQSLTVDYTVHFVKADGDRRPKVFKLRRLALSAGETVALQARVSFAPMTTRRSYPGRHAVDLRINGVDYPLGEFDVVSPAARHPAPAPSAG